MRDYEKQNSRVSLIIMKNRASEESDLIQNYDMTGGMVQVLEHLLSKYEAPSLKHIPPKTVMKNMLD
jgi:hypothetical protein